MAKVKIKSDQKHRAFQTVTLPEGLGTVTFDKNCEAEIEISEKDAVLLEEMEIGISIIKSSSLKPSTNSNKEEEEADLSNVEFTEDSLSQLSIKDLKAIAERASFPKEEYEKFKKKPELIAYLLEKVKALQEEEEEETE